MANPVIAEITTFDIGRGTLTGGACRQFWLRIPGLSAASDQDAGGNDDLYYLENPFKMDLVITRVLAVITTLDAQDADMDVGLADDAEGTSVGNEIIDSLVNTAAGVLDCTAPPAVTGTSKPIWKKAGTSTDSFLVITQNGDADVSDLRWHLYLEVIPYDDFIGREGEQAAVVVA